MTLKELRDKMAEAYKAIRALADKENDAEYTWSSEDDENWTRCNADYDAMKAQVERAERAEALEQHQQAAAAPVRPIEDRNAGAPSTRSDDVTAVAATVVTPELRDIALTGWCADIARVPLTKEQDAACRACGVDPRANEFVLQLTPDYRNVRAKYRAQGTPDAAGGYTIPDGFVPTLEKALLAFGGVRQVSNVIRTATGNDLHLPTTDDTGNAGVLLAENTQMAEQDVTFSELVLNAYKYSSKLVRVSTELMQDSAFNIAAILGELLGERLGRIQNTQFTTGSGSAQPNGIVTASTLGVTAASATAITTDELMNLLHSVDPAYRNGAGWMFNDATALVIRKLKDTTNQYLWQPGLQAGAPNMLFGFPVNINQDMATIAASAKSVLFGLLSKYQIREVASVRLRRSDDRYMDFDQTAFVALTRVDGDLLDAGTNPVKHLIQAAS